MSDIFDHIKQLTNADLRKELLKVGIRPGPLTPTTKKLYQRKLVFKLNEVKQTNKEQDEPVTELVPENQLETQDAFLSISEDSKQQEHVRFNENNNLETPKNEATCFYVVLTPSENKAVCSSIFDNKSDAWKLLQSNKQARFQQFSSLSKAQEFAHLETRIQVESETKTSNIEKPNNHPAPKQVALTELMQVIERGDSIKYDELVWDNPRLLISSADGPVPLKPSMRYNALHVAARSNQANMIARIISTLENLAFHERMYSNENTSKVNSDARTSRIIDLYLNTPEKGCFDSPLHIASKFGFTDVVAELISQPQCDKAARNKFGETPAQVACSRASSDSARNQILFLLNDHYYVPLIRCHDNSSPPVLGRPWNPSTSTLHCSPIPQNLEPHNPINPIKVVSALVGPMKQEEAFEVRHKWSTPNKNHQGSLLTEMRLSDIDKGKERVGRQIARENGLQWLEYWDFLEEYTDFSTTEGLSRLEKYLSRRRRKDTPRSKPDLSDADSLMNDLCLEVTRLNFQASQDEDEEKNTLSSSNPSLHSPSTGSCSSPSMSDLRYAQLNLMKRALKSKQTFPDETKSDFNSSRLCDHNKLFKSPLPLTELPVGDRARQCDDVFIHGSYPTKLDRDVLFAIPTSTDLARFPLVSKWMSAVLSHPEQDILTWKTPRKKKSDQVCLHSSFNAASPMPVYSPSRTCFPPISLSFN